MKRDMTKPISKPARLTAEERRLQKSLDRTAHWKRWGPYVSERAWEYFEMGVKDRAQAEAEYPGWLGQLLTHPVRGLENYRELFDKLNNGNGAIEVFCEVAHV